MLTRFSPSYSLLIFVFPSHYSNVTPMRLSATYEGDVLRSGLGALFDALSFAIK